MTPRGPQSHTYEVNAILRVSKECEDQIKTFFLESYSVRKNRLQSNLHLTVYHGRRVLPGLQQRNQPVCITADVCETRFMVLDPGGENPRAELDPQALSVGIRLTRRNTAIPEIQKLRKQVYRLETKGVIGTRKRTTAWTNCFGSRNYQPHVQLLRPWHKVNATLVEVGDLFRTEVKEIEFDLFQIEVRHRVDGQLVIVDMVEPRQVGTPVITHREATELKKLFDEDSA